MRRSIHEGFLYLDQHKRYCLYEVGVPADRTFTLTSGCPLEVWLNREWITGHVEGDGEDYWLFATGGSKFLLVERMRARYIERRANIYASDTSDRQQYCYGFTRETLNNE